MILDATRAEKNYTIENAKKRQEPLTHDQLVSDQINQIVDDYHQFERWFVLLEENQIAS